MSEALDELLKYSRAMVERLNHLRLALIEVGYPEADATLQSLKTIARDALNDDKITGDILEEEQHEQTH